MSHDLDTCIATYRGPTTHAEHPKRTHTTAYMRRIATAQAICILTVFGQTTHYYLLHRTTQQQTLPGPKGSFAQRLRKSICMLGIGPHERQPNYTMIY